VIKIEVVKRQAWLVQERQDMVVIVIYHRLAVQPKK